MGKNKVMELKQLKVKKIDNAARKWHVQTGTMLEIQYGEVVIPHHEAPKPAPACKPMHTYRVAYDYTRVLKFRTSVGVATMKKRIRAMADYAHYKLVEIVDIDGRDTNIAV